MVEFGADTWNVEEPNNNLAQMHNLHISAPLEEKLLTGSLRPPGKCHHKKNRMEEKKEDNARLPAQRPASRVLKKHSGNERQERKDAVSGRKDGNRGAGNTLARQQDRTERKSSAFGGKSQCVVEQRKSCGNCRLANVTTLPTANVEVTRTGGHTDWRARTTCNCRRHREGTSMREKRQRS